MNKTLNIITQYFRLNKLALVSIIFLSSITPFALNNTYGLRKCLFIFILLIIARCNLISVLIMFILSIMAALYLPVQMTYGDINIGIIFAINETNFNEALSIFSTFSFIQYILSITLFIFSYIYLYSYIKKKPNIKLSPKKNYLILLFLILLNFSPSIRLIKSAIKAFNSYQYQIGQVRTSEKELPSWNISFTDKKYKNIVIIIGESVRKDVLSVYGFSQNTTPFLNNTNGIFIDGAVSTAPTTTSSLIRTLAQTNKDNTISLSNNIVTLSKSAGYATYWLSNQGVSGYHNHFITKIGQYADKFKFIRQNMTDTTKLLDDFLLIEEFNKVIKNNNNDNVIFIHMSGSHFNACDRVLNYPNNYNLGHGKIFDCYLATINKLDSFIEQLNKSLVNTNEDYALIYFSDHGQVFTGDSSNLIIHHSTDFKEGYDVPLFILSNKIKEHIYIKKQFSFFNFLNLLSLELGESQNGRIKHDFTNFTESKNIKVFNNKKLINYNELDRNPVPQN
jgi:glucan phosphoethanolaminetransferase (alkaline phosphatase superfamily)